MPTFKLVERIPEYQYALVEAGNKEEAKQIYDEALTSLDWHHEEFGGDTELIAVDEITPTGSITHDIENGEFIDED